MFLVCSVCVYVVCVYARVCERACVRVRYLWNYRWGTPSSIPYWGHNGQKSWLEEKG